MTTPAAPPTVTDPPPGRRSLFRRLARHGWYRFKRLFRPATRRLDPWLARLAGRWRFTTGLYYLLRSSAFWREQQAVLQGLQRYEELRDAPMATSAVLRRNIHGLEKVFMMRPRPPCYAGEYIGATVDAYARLSSARHEAGVADAELAWAHDVLCQFFEISSGHPEIDAALERFRALPAPPLDADRRRVAFPHRELDDAPRSSYDALLALARHRRSVRWFEQIPVDRAVIDRALDVARHSPSSGNRQAYRFVVIDDRTLAYQVAAMSQGTKTFDRNIPVVVVIVGQLRSFFSERDRHVIYIDASLAAMAFNLALEAQGLGGCCLNWPDVEYNERRIAELLHLEPDERVVMLMAVGHPEPDGLVAYSAKKPLSLLRRFNQG